MDKRRWSALLVGRDHGWIGPLGDRHDTSPDGHERLDVVPAPALDETRAALIEAERELNETRTMVLWLYVEGVDSDWAESCLLLHQDDKDDDILTAVRRAALGGGEGE